MEPNQKLSNREKSFCRNFVYCGDPYEAAQKAGYSPKYITLRAAHLADRPELRAEIERLRGELLRECEAAALATLRRMALTPVNDALTLACADSPAPEEIAALDLFPVCDFRRVKGGGCEMKFVDRFKAASLLLDYGRAAKSGDSETKTSLLEAFARGAAAISGPETAHEEGDPDAL